MEQLSIQAVPAQRVSAVLGGQNVQLSIYQKTQGLFVDIASNGTDVSLGVLARNAVPLCPIVYTGFAGNFIFIDTQGVLDPTYAGLGSRYQLIYLEANEYAILQ